VVAVAAVNQHSPLAIMSLAKTVKLAKPADLKGLTIGIHPAGSTYIFFKGFLAANGLTEKDMTLNSVSPPYESYLLPGSLSIMMGADHGWKAYGSGLFTSEAMIKDKPDVAARFVKAYREAFDYVVAHPEEAAEITAKAAPGYADKKDVLLAQINADIASTFNSPDTKDHGLGWMTKTQWEETLKTLTDQGVLKAALSADDVFTDKFLAKE
ncbi:MAG: ABC transporter substrate-binding protein, partial [Mesorhizobium sp.]